MRCDGGPSHHEVSVAFALAGLSHPASFHIGGTAGTAAAGRFGVEDLGDLAERQPLQQLLVGGVRGQPEGPFDDPAITHILGQLVVGCGIGLDQPVDDGHALLGRQLDPQRPHHSKDEDGAIVGDDVVLCLAWGVGIDRIEGIGNVLELEVPQWQETVLEEFGRQIFVLHFPNVLGLAWSAGGVGVQHQGAALTHCCWSDGLGVQRHVNADGQVQVKVKWTASLLVRRPAFPPETATPAVVITVVVVVVAGSLFEVFFGGGAA